MLRGFYALERTRTVFWVQCLIAVTNILLALLLTAHAGPRGTAPGLVLAYAGSYLVGAAGSYSLLRRVLGGLETPVLVRFLVRLLIAAVIAVAVAWLARQGMQQLWSTVQHHGRGATSGLGKAQAVTVLGVTLLVDVAVFLALARAMRIREVTDVVGVFTARLRRRAPRP
jgi:putative peptidoglycan lipid II flippase